MTPRRANQAWEASPEASVSTMEQPLPRPIAEGFPGKVAVVTGGATGLGRAICLEFARLGCDVAFCYVNLPGRDVSEQALLTETTISSFGVRVHANRCDVRDPGAGGPVPGAIPAPASAASTSSSTMPASPTTARSGA